jgi:hypothetical protein
MSGFRRGLGSVVAALAALCALTAPAAAQEPLLRMTAVQVAGGEDAWHAEPVFRLDWTQEPGPPATARAVDYRLYDPRGNQVGKVVRNTEVVRAIGRIPVPPTPGAYTVEAWLENLEGQPGPHVTAMLRFDDAPPSPGTPVPVPGWSAAGKPVSLAIDPSPAPYPLSGIRGYAVAVDAEPCAVSTRCGPAEVDLPTGVEGGQISLGILPEGVHVVRVAAVSGAGVPSSTIEKTEVRVDGTAPVTALEGPSAGWSRQPVEVTAVSRDELSGMVRSQWGIPFTLIADGGEQVAYATGDRATALIGGNGVHELSFYGRDVAGNVADGQLGAPPPGRAVVRIDREPPAVVFAAGQDPAEPERIEATVADHLSGPSPRQGSIGVRRLGSGGDFEELPTQVEPGRLVARWDSDSYPPGAYEFRATGYDAAGNSAAARLRGDGRPMVLPSPLKTPVRLGSGFGAEPGPRKRPVPYGRWVRYGGRLRTVDGEPVPNAAVTVTETFAAGSAPATRTTLARTGADGSFSLRLAPGPSREVSAGFDGSRLLTRAAGTGRRLRVRGAVRLRSSAAVARIGGAPVVFSGRVGRLGASSLAGKTIELQFRYPGAGWSEFRTVETNAAGRFRYPYRFSDDDSRGVRFQFRAVVPAHEGWPYERGASRPVLVTGR